MSFDTLDYARRLRTAHVPTEQAEAMADALQAAFVAPHGVATKADIALLRQELVFHRALFGIVIAVQLATLAAAIGILVKLAQ